MNRNKPVIALFGIVLAFGFLTGCKKDQLNSSEDVNLLPSITQQWHAAFVKTASPKEAAASHLIVKDLDYSASYQLQGADEKPIIIVKLKTQTKQGNAKFLTLVPDGTTYALDGIYETSSIKTIRTFLSTKTFPANDSIVVRSLTGNPVKAWVTDDAGKMHYKKGFGVANGVDPKVAFLRQQKQESAALSVGLNAEPAYNPCMAWYWVWYDPWSGVIIGIDFLGTTGDCENNEGGGNGQQTQYLYCGQYTAADIAAMVAGAYLEDVDEVSHNNGQSYTDEQGRIRKPATPTWKVTECLVGSFSGKYLFTAYYAGVKFRTHAQDPSWKWESFAFSSFSGSWVSMPCAITITVNSLAHSETRRDDYVWDVALAFSATVNTNVPTIPVSAASNTVGTTGKVFSFDAAF